MGWSYSYYCSRLHTTIKNGDKIKIKGQTYTSAYKDGYGYNYTTVEEVLFYGVFSESSTVVTAPLCTMDSYGNACYFFTDSMIQSGGTPDSYILTLDGNGGNTQSYTVTYGTMDYNAITVPSRTGYTFKGYYTAASGGTQIYNASGAAVGDGTYWNSSKQWIYGGNVTLYAQWVANTYTITYKANGGSGSDQTQIATYGTAWTSKGAIFTKTGYTQTSWNTKSDGSGTTYSLSTRQTNAQLSNLTLYAMYTINNYTLTVNPNGGTWNGSMATQTFTQNYGTTKTIANPTRVGYTFSGWTLSGSGSLSGTKFTFGAGACTLTAKWTRIVLNVKFNASTNGGSPDSTKSVNYGDMIGKLPEPTKAFYKFVGWFTKSSGGSQISVSQVITANVTYYAQFKIDASVKVVNDGAKKPAIVWCKVSGAWKKCITWVKQNGKWYKSTGAD